MRIDQLTRRRVGSRGNPAPEDVAVFVALGRILARWREDPDRLAVAVAAYQLLGYNWPDWEVEYSHPDVPVISREEASRLVRESLYGRNREILRHRAEGLILALRDIAVDAEAWRLHGVREDACVIECRELPIDERIERLQKLEQEET